MSAEIRFLFRLPAGHPCLPGHFPGRPLVPGVVLLDAVLERLGAAAGGRVARLLRAKFSAPVAPEEAVEVVLWPAAPGRFAFRCHSGAALVLAGEAAVAPLAGPA
ncbi:hypothetical protein [Roseomonas sp. KE0001]|uniref:hypothetical protein n=1 Tax=unclassified Roseomonas TaxID=2617492 RepID=UPI0018E04C68|nr:hypothetical protein [Roseomonas sp. KE0001]MBI0434937.1 hydroxymyristoyl-ACP dehydratase [Roseomonas sp. KE0001]